MMLLEVQFWHLDLFLINLLLPKDGVPACVPFRSFSVPSRSLEQFLRRAFPYDAGSSKMLVNLYAGW
jgi:hypothetical protein